MGTRVRFDPEVIALGIEEQSNSSSSESNSSDSSSQQELQSLKKSKTIPLKNMIKLADDKSSRRSTQMYKKSILVNHEDLSDVLVTQESIRKSKVTDHSMRNSRRSTVMDGPNMSMCDYSE